MILDSLEHSAGCSYQPCAVALLSPIPECPLSPNSLVANSLILQVLAQRSPAIVVKYSVGPSRGVAPGPPPAVEDLSV